MKCTHPQTKDVTVNGTSFSYEYRCGQCMACRIHRREEWTAKILMESIANKGKSVFFTLTYSDEFLPADGNISKEECKKFIKRMRRHAEYHGNKKLRYYIVGEYGDKFGRPHYHGIIYGLEIEEVEKWIQKSWKKGYMTLSELNPIRARYAARYTTKKITQRKPSSDGRVNEFCLASRRPALGAPILQNVAESIKRRGYEYKDGLFIDKQGNRIDSISTGYLRLYGKKYPMDNHLQATLTGLLGIKKKTEYGKARELDFKLTMRVNDYAKETENQQKKYRSKKLSDVERTKKSGTL